MNDLLEIKGKINNLAEDELVGVKVQGLLTELRTILERLDKDPTLDKSRLSNLSTFVGNRQGLDPMVRKVLLGLIGKLANNPAAPSKPAPNMSDLMGKIPGLKEALKETDTAPAAKLESPSKAVKQPEEQAQDLADLMGKIPGLEAVLKDTDFQSQPARPAAGRPPQTEGIPQAPVAQIQTPVPEPVAGEEKPQDTPDKEIATANHEIAAAGVAQDIQFDTRELLGFFLQEAGEQVEKLSNGLVDLEKDGGHTELINELFRTAHTLKGTSGTMGFTSIVKITHLSEDILDNLRQGKCRVTPELVDILLSVADRVRGIIADIQANGEESRDVSDLVDRLERFLGKPSSVQPKEEPVVTAAADSNFTLDEKSMSLVKDAQQQGLKVYEFTVNFHANVLMPSVRAVMAVRRLEKHCKVLSTFPSAEELRQEKHADFKILLATDKAIRFLENLVLQVAEIESVTSMEFEAEAIPVEVINMADVVKRQEKNQEFRGTSDNFTVSSSQGSVPVKNQTIRVPAERLDDLLNLVGEMVIARTRLVSVGDDLRAVYSQEHSMNELTETTVYLGRLMNELQESVMAMRMVPIGHVFSRFPRLVRDLARQTGKEIELVWYGEDTELDKTIIQEIGDPLMHILRNSIDHGIETPADRVAAGKSPSGKITVEAFHEGSHIIITVSDDGKGIDFKKVKEKALEKGYISSHDELSDKEITNLIFLPGLSTASKVTDVSGRGVGMDVVKKSLVNLGGMIDIDSKPGKGTTFTVRLPLTLAIIQALLVEVSDQTYALPLASVLETLRVSREEILSVGGHAIIQLRGSTLPLISLYNHFGLEESNVSDDVLYVVVVGFGEKRLGLVVNGLQGQQEIVIKSLGDFLSNVQGFSGATIGGDGRVTLILDVGSLIHDTLVVNRA
ncbi:MAG TPA: chemotaxis protein CheA [Verrucomicrobiae bacterium]|nr:chemotaxis protein CheA [Verrucomicrobiae bacterium]